MQKDALQAQVQQIEDAMRQAELKIDEVEQTRDSAAATAVAEQGAEKEAQIQALERELHNTRYLAEAQLQHARDLQCVLCNCLCAHVSLICD